MIGMLQEYLTKRRIGRFITELPSHLARRYGRSDFYTQGQIKTTLDELNFSPRDRGYSFVLFMAQDDAAEVLGSIEVTELMTQELAAWFFNGNRDFRSRWMVRTNTTEAQHLAE